MQQQQPGALSLQISPGQDEQAVREQATALLERGRWQLCADGRGLERSFRFKGFKATWDFMNAVANECKQQRHHPEWSNVYNKTHIRWTTHKPLGLSGKDTHMAGFCDEAATRFGEILEGSGASEKSSEKAVKV